MSARTELAANLNGRPAPPRADELCEWLTAQLGLAERDLTVVGAEVFGRGPSASVDLRLSDGAKLTFERFGDVAKPTSLTAHLVTLTGVARTFKASDAVLIAAVIQQLASHHAEESADAAAREWGSEYLRIAPTLEIDLSDQADRWRGFQVLESIEPARDAGEDRSAWGLAAKGLVLVDRQSGVRLVRTGWLQAYVRREVGGLYSPAQLAVQMERVGWTRQGSQGRVKATRPSDGSELVWSFYAVAADWERR